VADLKGIKALGSSAKQLEQIEKTERRYITKLLQEFLAESRHESLDWWQGQINAIQALDEEYELVTKRLLEFVWRNGYEKSWFAERDGNLERAVYLAQVSLLVRPQDPYLNYNLARLQALDHQLETALKTLRLAVASGYSDRDRIESDLAFAPFLENPELQEILDRIGDQ
jgi:Flp pilus assembly protein TadD